MNVTNFSGFYNASNILTGMIAAQEIGVSMEKARSSLKDVYPLPHRIELISENAGKKWIEDSKSTTSQSQTAALDAMPDDKTVLIAG